MRIFCGLERERERGEVLGETHVRCMWFVWVMRGVVVDEVVGSWVSRGCCEKVMEFEKF